MTLAVVTLSSDRDTGAAPSPLGRAPAARPPGELRASEPRDTRARPVGSGAAAADPARGRAVADGAVTQGEQLASLAGVVVDRPSGAPLAHAVVAVRLPDGVWTVTADARGAFELDRLPPGPCELRAWAPGHAPGGGESFFLAEGARREAVLALDAGASLAGRVVDVRGTPLPGVRVSVVSFAWGGDPLDAFAGGEDEAAEGEDEDEEGDAGRRRAPDLSLPQAVALTGPDGAFRLEHLQPGPAVVRATRPRSAAAWRELEVPAAGGVEGLELVLGPGAAIRGQVHFPPPGPGPVALATIRAVRLDDGSSPPIEEQVARLDAQGRYALEGLTPGTYRLEVMASRGGLDDPLWMRRIEPLVLGAAEELEQDVELSDPAPVELTGTIRSGGLRLAGEELSFVDATGVHWPAQADVGGSFRLALPPGRYQVCRGPTLVSELQVSAAASQVADFDLDHLARLQVRLVDAATREPLQGLMIWAGPVAPAEQAPIGAACTDADGEAVLEVRPETPVWLTLGPSGPLQGHASRRLGPYSLLPGEARRLPDVLLERDVPVRLRVRGSAGQPVLSVRVSACPAPGDPSGEPSCELPTRVVTGGLLEVAGLGPGLRTLTLRAPGHADLQVVVPVPSADPVEVSLGPAGRLE